MAKRILQEKLLKRFNESQNVKNDAAKTTKAVNRLRAQNIFALSGTPIENNLNELWSLFSIISNNPITPSNFL